MFHFWSFNDNCFTICRSLAWLTRKPWGWRQYFPPKGGSKFYIIVGCSLLSPLLETLFFIYNTASALSPRVLSEYNMIVSQRTRNEKWLCWRGPAAFYQKDRQGLTSEIVYGVLARIQFASGRSCDRPSRSRFPVVFLRTGANEEFVPKLHCCNVCSPPTTNIKMLYFAFLLPSI
jgi:hypothetical protein